MAVLYTLPAFEVTDRRVLEGVKITSSAARRVSDTEGHKVRVGVQDGGGTDWLATWDQRRTNLSAFSPKQLLDVRYHRLRHGDMIVVSVEKYGTPASLFGTSVTLEFRLTSNDSGEPEPLIGTPDVGSGPQQQALALNSSSLITPSFTLWLSDGP